MGFGMVNVPGSGLRSRIRATLLAPRLRRIKLLVCDVDGVLTDGGLHYDESGRVLKRFDVRDGLAVRMLQRVGISVALLSGGRSGAIEQRALHLGIEHCRVGVADKQAGVVQLQQQLTMAPQVTVFVGDDLNDLVVRPVVDLLVTPRDAVDGLRRRADWVLRHRGGDGALRELAEGLLASRGEWQQFQRHGWREINV